MSFKTNFYKYVNEHSKVINSLEKISPKINKVIKKLYSCLKSGNKILICGNGGSAADAQHLSAEFLVRLRPNINRKPIPAINLCLDTSTITACSNDYSFEKIFSRNLEALGSKKDGQSETYDGFAVTVHYMRIPVDVCKNCCEVKL